MQFSYAISCVKCGVSVQCSEEHVSFHPQGADDEAVSERRTPTPAYMADYSTGYHCTAPTDFRKTKLI
jgi:hypothetical protein